MPNNNPSSINAWQRLAQSMVMPVASRFTSGAGRVGLILVALVIVGYLLYRSVWVPFGQEATLPAGVSPTNPELAADVLNDINADRTARIQSPRQNFSRFTALFVPSR